MTLMSDDELDEAIAGYLGWRSRQVDGAPEASAVARRIADAQVIHRPRWRLASSAIVVVALLSIVLVGAILVAGRQTEPVSPLANGPIVVSNAGWRAIDPASRAESAIEPCDGLCRDALLPVPSADGKTVFYVVPTPMGPDERPTEPGWSLWRWGRDAGTTTRVHVCPSCMITRIVPSPDGRSVAMIETPGPRTYLADVVVVDAVTGREIYRSGDLGSPWHIGALIPTLVPAWDANSRLLLGRYLDDQPVRQRIDLTTGVAEDVGRDLPFGVLWNAPDGRGLAIGRWGERVEIYAVDDAMTEATLLETFGAGQIESAAWAPDGTRLAVMLRTELTGPARWDYEIAIVDLATGAVDRRPTEAVAGQLLWLPAD